MLRNVELGAALLTGLAGFLGWAYALFGPTYESSSGATANVAGTSLNTVSASFFAVMLAILVGIVDGAYLHALRRRAAGRGLLAACVIVLSVLAIISGFSVGIFFLPAVALAWLTLFVSLFVGSGESAAR